MQFTSTNIALLIAIILAIFVIEAFLASRKQPFWGLLLPVASFLFSIYVIFNFKEFIGDHGFEGYEVWGWYALQFFLGNVPTFILLTLFSMFRYNKSRDEQDD